MHTFIHREALYGHHNRVREMLMVGTPVDSRNEYEATPLMLAARNGKIRCMRVLIEAGADVNARKTDGETALHRAIEFGLPSLSVMQIPVPRPAKLILPLNIFCKTVVEAAFVLKQMGRPIFSR